MISGNFENEGLRSGSSHQQSEALKGNFSCLFEELGKQEGVHDPQEVLMKLAIGQVITRTLLDINAPLPEATKESALNLTWFIMASAYQENFDVFSRGTVRLSNLSEEQSKRFKHFYNNCSEAHAHNRPSSHFREETVGHQKGVDFEKGTLPFDKELGTLLCGRLKDGDFFIKLERESVSLLKPIETIKHLYNWATHIASGGGKQEVGGKPTRRETDGIKESGAHFKEIVSVWNEITPLSKINSQGHNKIAKMHSVVTDILRHIKQENLEIFTGLDDTTHTQVEEIKANFQNKYKKLESSLQSFRESISDIKYPEKASGKEILFDISQYTQ